MDTSIIRLKSQIAKVCPICGAGTEWCTDIMYEVIVHIHTCCNPNCKYGIMCDWPQNLQS